MIYFNEIDPVACAVLREAHQGVVDDRSIKEVLPDDVRGFERAHFFAGAGLWQIAADMAGWRGPLWTASCPCQPFSVAGKGAGKDDPRHLWPDFFRLARAVRPPVIVGEQVAGAAGFDWFDGVAADLAREGYACRAVDIPACAVDAPHRRQRLYWVAVGNSASDGWPQRIVGAAAARHGRFAASANRCDDGAMADADGGGRRGRPKDAQRGSIGGDAAQWADVGLGDAASQRQQRREDAEWVAGGSTWWPNAERTDRRDGGPFWLGAEWIACADGKARRAKPGIRLLVDGMAGRADLWRLAGNSIVPQIAAEVLAALAETLAQSNAMRAA